MPGREHLTAWLAPTLVIAATVIGCLALHEFAIRRVRWLRTLLGLRGRTQRVASKTDGVPMAW
ncbi:hypothetical protein XpopCFBP1817_08885 [Xanthomonas populi]|uniref:Uncharacterized protein n=1 Tax=Xanthomonas populi TaxID=53414 RepID=A0A2S7EQC9_9XANT|nr:hypothetical protein XpopCFBP1817_08885 [Xanthomonas populi]